MLNYIPSMNDYERKTILDDSLASYKAQAVGCGYIDIIVRRENYKAFAIALIENGFEIEAISWWEYLDKTGMSTTYGIGGPRSRFYEGWFAETVPSIDEIPSCESLTEMLAVIIEIVENKVLGEFDGHLIGYANTSSITPAFGLRGIKDWKNVQSFQETK